MRFAPFLKKSKRRRAFFKKYRGWDFVYVLKRERRFFFKKKECFWIRTFCRTRRLICPLDVRVAALPEDVVVGEDEERLGRVLALAQVMERQHHLGAQVEMPTRTTSAGDRTPAARVPAEHRRVQPVEHSGEQVVA